MKFCRKNLLQKTFLKDFKVRKSAKIRNQYNRVPHLKTLNTIGVLLAYFLLQLYVAEITWLRYDQILTDFQKKVLILMQSKSTKWSYGLRQGLLYLDLIQYFSPAEKHGKRK